MKKLPFFLSKITTNAYCQQPRTLSFRAGDIINNHNHNNNMFKTLNSVYNSEEPESPSPVEPGEISVESVIRGLRTVDRLFFKPGESETSSILEEASSRKGVNKVSESQVKVDENDQILNQSVVMSMDSQDPYIDFKKSMEEMVEAHGLKDWDSLEELLCCYLKVNGKNNHGYIIGAFVDLLVTIAFSSSSSPNLVTNNSSSSYSSSSPLSFYTSSNFSDDSSSTPCISSLEEADDEEGNSHLCCLLEVENEIKEIN